MALLSGTSAPLSLQALIVPFVCLLIAFLGYGSQLLFACSPDLLPGQLTTTQSRVFNTLLCCLWWTYYRACTVDPGRYVFPRPKSAAGPQGSASDSEEEGDEDAPGSRTREGRRRRYCRKCAAPKPPRAHHCKACHRCVPKMDHHCPWTGNCVSLQTFPHFLRFLLYANVSLWTFFYFLLQRFRALWSNRDLPAYLGPTLAQLVWLTVFVMVGGITTLALAMIFATTLKSWVFNMTMIESWEEERHEAVLERRETEVGWWRSPGSGVDEQDAAEMEVEPVEFPYDIGFFANMAQAMGTSIPLLWFFPLAGGPRVAEDQDGKMTGVGWEYEENGLNDREDMWPPVDPAKVRSARVWRERRREMEVERQDYEAQARWATAEQEKDAFRDRQQRDLRRWENNRKAIINELEEVDGYDSAQETYEQPPAQVNGAATLAQRGLARPERRVLYEKAGWANADGEQLGDYGVDEDADEDEHIVEEMMDGQSEEQSDDENVPLTELIRRRKVLTKDSGDT
jgi:palmitoyltransferase